MSFTPEERTVLAALADVLIPAGNGFPSASQAAVAKEGLDYVLNCRPELLSGIKSLLASAQGTPAAEFLKHLYETDPAAFGILADLVPGAYFLNPTVREKLRYSGQEPRPIDPHPDYLDDNLLQSVIQRGPIYRPTPKQSVTGPEPT